MRAVLHEPGEGERHTAGGESSVTIKATGEDTGGSFYLGEAVIQAGFPGPPLHVHEQLHDMFYVLEGTLTMRLGDETRELGPGSFVCVPPGAVHTFSNPGSAPVRFLNFNTPPGGRTTCVIWVPPSRAKSRRALRTSAGSPHVTTFVQSESLRYAH